MWNKRESQRGFQKRVRWAKGGAKMANREGNWLKRRISRKRKELPKKVVGMGEREM
jgi:hypothetical protein